MLKKVILTSLFFILATGIFGMLATKAHAADPYGPGQKYEHVGDPCTTINDPAWSGQCVIKQDCIVSSGNRKWDSAVTTCMPDENPDKGYPVGCCGIKPGTPDAALPGIGEKCTAGNTWPGICTDTFNCLVIDFQDNGVWDRKTCKAGGCCATKPVTTGQKTCTLIISKTESWPGLCSLFTECNKDNSNINFNPDPDQCMDVYKLTAIPGCCAARPGSPETKRPTLGQTCKTSDGRRGVCTTNQDCNQKLPDEAWDIGLCLASGCCVKKSSSDQATKVCEFAGTNVDTCHACMADGLHAWTAFGCIPTDPATFIGQVIGIGVGIGGGIAFLLILFGGFQILMSGGNPERLNAGKELVTSAITGLLIIIFSIFILRLIGVTILGIPGFL